jgi:uncharacterized membrane protein required for colicin V production
MNEALAPLQSIDPASALQSFVAYGVVWTCVVLCGLAGLRIKFFGSILAFAAFIIAAVAAFIWSDAAGRLIRAFGCPASWSLALGYVAVFLVCFAVLKLLLRILVRTEVMTYPAIVDRLGGLAVGMLAGVFLASVVRVGLAMSPVTSTVRPSPEQLQVDVTARVLRMVSQIISSDPAARRAWLHGEAGEPAGQGKRGQFAWSEPYIDLNGNDQFDRDEPFLDKNGDGRFTPAFMFANKEPTPDLCVGAMERYWLGNWQRVKVMVQKPGNRVGPGGMPEG